MCKQESVTCSTAKLGYYLSLWVTIATAMLSYKLKKRPPSSNRGIHTRREFLSKGFCVDFEHR